MAVTSTNEIWKDVPGYEKYYQVSNLGRARSKDRVRLQQHPSGKLVAHTYKGKIIALDYSTSSTGFLNIYDCDTRKSLDMYHLIFDLFGESLANGLYKDKRTIKLCDNSNDDSEIWKDIPGYEGFYQASNLGNIRKIQQNKLCSTKYVKLKMSEFNHYYSVTLSKNHESSGFTVHRLIAQTFICNPENKPEVNHIDGNKHNNRVENLEWVTRSENTLHAYRMGLKKISARTLKNATDCARKVNSLPIKCVTTGQQFISVLDASKQLNLSYAKLRKAIDEPTYINNMLFVRGDK